MTTREFDPVFSAALRNELEALADGAGRAAPTAVRRPLILRPQLWISVVTAVVLVAATIGVLHLTHTGAQPADPGQAVVDPLSRVTDPNSDEYVARSVTVLIDARGLGSGTSTFTSPADVDSMQVYLNCSASSKYSVSVDGDGGVAGACDGDTGSNYSTALKPGTHTATVTVHQHVRWSLLIIEKPAPTVATGALIDPLTQVRDRRDPDAIIGDTRPLLQLSGSGDLAPMPATVAVPQGVDRLRVFFACTPTSAGSRIRIDGHVVSGCQNAIAHWFDFTPSARSIAAQVEAEGDGEYAVLVVPAPKGAKDSPANTLPSYPSAPGAQIARARGIGAQAVGTYRTSSPELQVTMSCSGTGWLEVQVGGSGTDSRGNACSTTHPDSVGFEINLPERGKAQRWAVTPHGDISWTFQLTTG